jgi:NADP-dependent 3-hydroxy acid dehydrogenase YdfG
MNKKLVVITGASSGIGKELAKYFSLKGHALLLLARRLQPMLNINLPNTMCISLDIKEKKQLQIAINKAENKFGPVACLINNAGIVNFGEFTDKNLKYTNAEIINTNILGYMNGIEIILPRMQKIEEGTILNISSGNDRYTSPYLAAYGATKAAIKSLTDSLASENAGKNVRICNIAPGLIDTPIFNPIKFQQLDEFKRTGEMIKTKEFAEIVYWIYSQPQHICIKDILLAPTNWKI